MDRLVSPDIPHMISRISHHESILGQHRQPWNRPERTSLEQHEPEKHRAFGAVAALVSIRTASLPSSHLDELGRVHPHGVSLESYDGIAWTGCSLTIYKTEDERVRRQIGVWNWVERLVLPSRR